MIFFCLGIQSTDHGGLIGGILGGICFVAIMAIVCILVAMKRRQSYTGILLLFQFSFLPLNCITEYSAQPSLIASVQILLSALMLALLEN